MDGRRLLIFPHDADLETQRTVAALSQRGTVDIQTLRHDSPASLAIDLLKLRKRAAGCDVVHAFGGRALALAVGATRSARIIFSPVGLPTRRLASWLRAIASYRQIDAVCSSDEARRALVTRGVPDGRVHLIRAGVNLASIRTGRDRALRARLGFGDDDTVLFCPLEITHRSGHQVAMWAVSILNILQPQYKLLVWGRGAARHTLDDRRERVLDSGVMRVATGVDPSIEVEPLFAAADLCLFTPTGPVSPLPVAMAMASGKAIVSTVSRQLCELIEDRHTAMLVPQMTPRAIAHRILDTAADATLSWKLADRARAEVYDHLTQAKMLQHYARLYAGEAEPARPSPSLVA
jgi:glycosyltransferase involved in cell wall biosynthesis